MEVILLERIANLGQMGDVVRVKDGYARNCLLPKGKALRANANNKKRFEDQRAQLEARNLTAKSDASKLAVKIDGKSFIIIRQAGETGQLYGSVSTRDIADQISADGITIKREQVTLSVPIKTLGVHALSLKLHPEVDAAITINVARSPEEAERQAKGEDLMAREETTMDDLGLEVGAALADAGGSLGDR